MVLKHITSIFMAALMLFTMSVTTVSATENDTTPTATAYNVEVTSDGITSITDENGNVAPASVYSSISGYGQATLNSNPAGITIYANASGIGGMGATVECSSSWNGTMTLDILSSDGKTQVTGLSVPSKGTWYLDDHVSNVVHYSPSYFLFSFRGIPSGQSVFVKIWIYG